MAKRNMVLTDTENNVHEADFKREVIGGPPTNATWSVARRTLRGGLREGVDTIEIDNSKFRFVVVPTRGMGLWKAWLGDTKLGWNSPVHGPVHPQYVPLTDPTGLGWLEGFDELMCRCGLESNGAPDVTSAGIYKYPLHGRIANRPAHLVELTTNDETGELSVTGIVDETRFLFQKLRMKSTYVTKIGQSGLRIIDEVTNRSGSPAEMQLLYHVNFGPPILDPGAKIVAPVKSLMPRDARAAEGISTWDSYANEQAGYSEQVYFAELAADSDDMTAVLLKNAHSTQGVSLRFSKKTLPYFTLWKNTPTAADGYVTGLEPGTNLPNPRTFEGQQGRVVGLAAGETARFAVELEVHATAQAVSTAEQAIARLQGGANPQFFDAPQPGWTKTQKA